MAGDKKPGLEVILGMGKPKGKPMPMGDESEPDKTGGGTLEAAQSVLDAVKTDDASALMKALKAFVTLADEDDGTSM